jgi:hypothetical protein
MDHPAVRRTTVIAVGVGGIALAGVVATTDTCRHHGGGPC